MVERERGSDHPHSHAPEKGLEHGVPTGATEEIPMGLPTSDRHHSETAPSRTGGDAETPKHDYRPDRPD